MNVDLNSESSGYQRKKIYTRRNVKTASISSSRQLFLPPISTRWEQCSFFILFPFGFFFFNFLSFLTGWIKYLYMDHHNNWSDLIIWIDLINERLLLPLFVRVVFLRIITWTRRVKVDCPVRMLITLTLSWWMMGHTENTGWRSTYAGVWRNSSQRRR